MNPTSKPMAYREDIEGSLKRHGLDDPAAALSGLLEVLRDLHVEAIGFEKGALLDTTTGERSVSLADALAKAAAASAERYRRVASGLTRRTGADPEVMYRKAAGARAIADILGAALGEWRAAGLRLHEKGSRPFRDVS